MPDVVTVDQCVVCCRVVTPSAVRNCVGVREPEPEPKFSLARHRQRYRLYFYHKLDVNFTTYF